MLEPQLAGQIFEPAMSLDEAPEKCEPRGVGMTKPTDETQQIKLRQHAPTAIRTPPDMMQEVGRPH